MPLICIRSVVFLKGPFALRYSMIRSAAFAPTRGRSANCEASAVLMLITAFEELAAGAAVVSAMANVEVSSVTRRIAMRVMDFRIGSFLLFFLFVVCFAFGFR